MNTFYTKLPFLVNTYQKFWSISTDARLFMIKTTIHVFNYNIHVARTSIANPQGLGEDCSFAGGLYFWMLRCISAAWIFFLSDIYAFSSIQSWRGRGGGLCWKWRNGKRGGAACASMFVPPLLATISTSLHEKKEQFLLTLCHVINWIYIATRNLFDEGKFYCRLVYNYRLSTLYNCTF